MTSLMRSRGLTQRPPPLDRLHAVDDVLLEAALVPQRRRRPPARLEPVRFDGAALEPRGRLGGDGGGSVGRRRSAFGCDDDARANLEGVRGILHDPPVHYQPAVRRQPEWEG